MQKTAISLIVLVVLLWAARNIALGICASIENRRARQTRNKERTRRQFAEARNALMNLAIAKDVDVNSLSFRFFYYINTAFMRRPDQYREISIVLVNLFLNQHDSSSGEELLAESRHWSPSFKSVVRLTAGALGYVVLDYSWSVRLMFRLEKRMDPESTPFRMLKRIAEHKEKPIVEIQETQAAMYRLADNPLSIATSTHMGTLAQV